jgi:hypothetical protein
MRSWGLQQRESGPRGRGGDRTAAAFQFFSSVPKAASSAWVKRFGRIERDLPSQPGLG